MASPFCLANSTDSRRIWIPVEACLAGYSMPRIKNLRIVIIPRSLPEIFAFYIYNLRLESKYILNSYSIVIDLFYFIIYISCHSLSKFKKSILLLLLFFFITRFTNINNNFHFCSR